ncbi:MAG TPA: hypothetical protein VGR15_04920 [Bacteroidota bacterium]|jgi:Spy/CpxP family protein refolding chaperone|nr:hypothetical protein [Bacteroidota bacterium]
MKYSFVYLLLIITILAGSDPANAQRRRIPRDTERRRPERVEKFRKMRLIEVLKLGEEDAVRFMAKQTAHEEVQRGLMKSRNEALNSIEDLMGDKKEDKKDIQKYTDEALGIDQKIFSERQRYQEDVRKMLTPEQFGEFLVFERNFGRQVKDALQEMRDERRERSRY